MASGLEIHRGRIQGTGLIITLAIFAVLGTLCFWIFNWYVNGDEPPVPLPVASADPRIDETPVPKDKIDNYKVPASDPRYLSIPKLDVKKTRVMNVGLTNNGQLDVPKNIDDVAWYRKSARPGEGAGAVLIDGHNGGIRRDGVFAKLGTLQEGDEIKVERGDGEAFTYQVVENESMTLEEANKSGMKKMMYSAQSDKEGLNLITCDGKWVPKDQVFDRRIMLRAVLVD